MRKQLIILSLLLFCCFPRTVYANEEVPVYQLYYVGNKEHYYTTDIEFRNKIVKDGWAYEGISWFAPSYSDYPVYQLYSTYLDRRVYTMDKKEKEELLASGYIDEGIAWYSSANEAVPIFENEKTNQRSGAYSFTTNFSEYQYLKSEGWKQNGIVSYALRKATKEESIESNRSLTYTYGYCYYVDDVLIVNKKHGLNSSYAPGEDPVAGAAIRNLISTMRSAGYDISTYYSGYRSYQTQAQLYNNYVNQDGKEAADTYSARPGFSEHQTGLAFDLCNKNYQLVESTREVNWISQNAHKYGFIVRFQKGKEHITGYQAEPWHLRYLGVELATKVYQSGLTLEEYLHVSYGDY
ncbi:MAG: D-alanyl-D-alanine carboxypeptidase family protein [Bacillota bacterium]|nr:D-alanyl-D-alanine carboxypeptidase family protein [Bacillota bacterium]